MKNYLTLFLISAFLLVFASGCGTQSVQAAELPPPFETLEAHPIDRMIGQGYQAAKYILGTDELPEQYELAPLDGGGYALGCGDQDFKITQRNDKTAVTLPPNGAVVLGPVVRVEAIACHFSVAYERATGIYSMYDYSR
jgi:hypothetical protein